MLHAMLVAAGLNSRLCGNIGSPVLDVLGEPADLLAVELSSFQLYWAPSLRPEAGVVLNIAEDHLDWHSTLADYAAAKAGVLRGRVETVRKPLPRATLGELMRPGTCHRRGLGGIADQPTGSVPRRCCTPCSSPQA